MVNGEHRTGTNAYRQTCAFDPAGDRTLKNVDGTRTTYGYDSANQLRYGQAVAALCESMASAARNATLSRPTVVLISFFPSNGDHNRMPNALIDTHCHLDAEAFHQDIDEVLRHAHEAQVEHILTIGITVETSQAAVVLANRYPHVSAVVGIQPNYVHECRPGDWERIVDLARHPRVVGIGETGLDKYWDFAPIDLQQEYFIRHIELARQCRKPFVVHCREAESEVLEVLRSESQHGPLNGLMHSFCGSQEVARECIELGLFISFAGMVTYKKNQPLRDVARTVPLERILVETDAPYLAPHPNRGKRNEPAWVKHTAACLAEVHGLSADEFAAITSANARRLFNLPVK